MVMPGPTPACACAQGVYHVATLRLCETLDELGLSTRSSELEVALGAYWEVSQLEEELARQQVQLQSVIKQATSKFTSGGLGATSSASAMQRMLSIGRSSIMSTGSQTSRRRRPVQRSP